VLTLLGEGLRWGEIAERLVISPKTVATHVENIRRKLDVTSRAEAIAVAYRDHLLAPRHPTPARPDAATSATPYAGLAMQLERHLGRWQRRHSPPAAEGGGVRRT
jgi:hypothetical protein